MKRSVDFSYSQKDIDASVSTIEKIDVTFIDNKFDVINLDCKANINYIDLDVSGKDNHNADIYIKDYISSSGGMAKTDNVFFSEDIVCAGDYTQIGNITKGLNETVVIPAKNKSVSEVVKKIFTKELQPSKTEPSVGISFPQSGSYEVGTTINPSYSTSFNPGSYTYGGPTGVVATSWNVIDSDGNSSTKTSDRFNSFVVTDNTNYKITATAEHTEGTIALTNLGNKSNPIVKIQNGAKSRTSSNVTGYRCVFYGVIDHDDPLTSADVRNLTNGGRAQGKTVEVKVNGDNNAKRICMIIPISSHLNVKTVMKTDGLATDITATYSKTSTVMVDGKDNHNLLTGYDVWTYKPAKIDAYEIHEITIG